MTQQHSDPKLVAVLCANGRMGAEAVKAVEAAPDMKLVAALGRRDSLDQVTAAGAQYLVDLTVPESTEANVRFAVEHGIHAVVGTTGWDAGRLSALEALLAEHPDTGVLIAPNFAVGSVLASAFAAKATTSELAGARGCEVDGVRVHSVRLRGLVAHQEVLLGGPGEQLTFRHDSYDRASFMPGVLLGVRNVAAHPGLTVGLDGYLDLGI